MQQTLPLCDQLLVFLYTGDEFPGHTAASQGNVQLLSMLLIEGHCGVNDQDTHGSTAAHKGALLCGGVHAVYIKGSHSFSTAAGNGHLECLQLLIDHGANGK